VGAKKLAVRERKRNFSGGTPALALFFNLKYTLLLIFEHETNEALEFYVA